MDLLSALLVFIGFIVILLAVVYPLFNVENDTERKIAAELAYRRAIADAFIAKMNEKNGTNDT